MAINIVLGIIVIYLCIYIFRQIKRIGALEITNKYLERENEMLNNKIQKLRKDSRVALEPLTKKLRKLKYDWGVSLQKAKADPFDTPFFRGEDD